MQRHLLGIIAVVLLLAGAVGLFLGFAEDSNSGMAAGVGVRVGLILGAWWLAFPQLQQLLRRVPPWLTGTLVVGAAIVVIRPRTIVFVAPLVGILAVLQFLGWLFKPLPLKKSHPRSSPHRKPPSK